MFSRKCDNCDKKISKKYSFCPHCGEDLNKEANEKDFGMLGTEDLQSNNPLDNIKLPFGFNTLFKQLIKQIDKELGKEFKNLNLQNQEQDPSAFKIRPNPNNSISIRFGTIGGKPVIKSSQPIKIRQQAQPIIPTNTISEEKLKQFSKLPKKQTKSKIRRLSDKIIYEIDMPGVESTDDILINKLENSIEIKALAKKAVLLKTIQITLPILKYKLEKEKLILELGEK